MSHGTRQFDKERRRNLLDPRRRDQAQGSWTAPKVWRRRAAARRVSTSGVVLRKVQKLV